MSKCHGRTLLLKTEESYHEILRVGKSRDKYQLSKAREAADQLKIIWHYRKSGRICDKSANRESGRLQNSFL
jgi:hypothetical protein